MVVVVCIPSALLLLHLPRHSPPPHSRAGTTLYAGCNNVTRTNLAVLFVVDLLASLSLNPSSTPNPVVPQWQLISPGGIGPMTVDSFNNVYYCNFFNNTFSVAAKLSGCRRNVAGASNSVGHWPV